MEDVLIHVMEELHCMDCCDIQNVGEIGFRIAAYVPVQVPVVKWQSVCL